MYLILPLINSPAFPPVASSKYPNDIMPKCKSDGQNSAGDPAETVMSLFA